MDKRFLLLIVFVIMSCQERVNYYNLPTFSNNKSVNAVVEISAGKNTKLEYNKEQNVFKPDIENGKERVINFLPYPGNYGFIPSTLSKKDNGGDGDAIDVLIISQGINTGAVIEILPIGILKLIDNGEEDFKIIAVPVDKSLQVIDVKNFYELSTNYSTIKEMIELWFLNYNKNDEAKTNGWGDEKEALLIIEENKLL